jgi:hypothetical protein
MQGMVIAVHGGCLCVEFYDAGIEFMSPGDLNLAEASTTSSAKPSLVTAVGDEFGIISKAAESAFPKGTIVEVHSLANSSSFNGKLGKVAGYTLRETGEFVRVSLGDHWGVKAVRPENLKVVEAATWASLSTPRRPSAASLKKVNQEPASVGDVVTYRRYSGCTLARMYDDGSVDLYIPGQGKVRAARDEWTPKLSQAESGPQSPRQPKAESGPQSPRRVDQFSEIDSTGSFDGPVAMNSMYANFGDSAATVRSSMCSTTSTQEPIRARRDLDSMCVMRGSVGDLENVEGRSCTSRWPKAGDLVTATSRKSDGNKWVLNQGEVATVITVDIDGDFTLRNTAGIISKSSLLASSFNYYGPSAQDDAGAGVGDVRSPNVIKGEPKVRTPR